MWVTPAESVVKQAIYGEIANVDMSYEEGLYIVSKVRELRDNYLSTSEKGRYYVELYNELGPEIIESLMQNPQAISTAVELLREVADRVDNIFYYLENGDPVIDQEFESMTYTILEELTSHTSDEMQVASDVIIQELDIVTGMSAAELIEYFGFGTD